MSTTPATRAVEPAAAEATDTSPSTREFSFLTNHGKAAAPDRARPADPHAGHRRLLDITERATQRIVAELDRAGYIERERVGRRNRYTVSTHRALGLPTQRDLDIKSLRGPRRLERLAVTATRLLGRAGRPRHRPDDTLRGPWEPPSLVFPLSLGATFLLLRRSGRRPRFPGTDLERGLERLFALLLPSALRPRSQRPESCWRSGDACGARRGARRWGTELQLITTDGYEAASRIAAATCGRAGRTTGCSSRRPCGYSGRSGVRRRRPLACRRPVSMLAYGLGAHPPGPISRASRICSEISASRRRPTSCGPTSTSRPDAPTPTFA